MTVKTLSILLSLFLFSNSLRAATSVSGPKLGGTRLDRGDDSRARRIECLRAKYALSISDGSLLDSTNHDLAGQLNQAVNSAAGIPDGFEYVRQLGQGGEGIVYLVKAVDDGELFVAKVGPIERIREERTHRLSLRGQRINAQRLILIGPEEKSIWEDPARRQATILLQYIKGKTLEEYIEQGRLKDPERIIQVVRLLADQVSAYHRKADKAHMDLKPANVMMPNGYPKLMDFGLAMELGARRGQRAGTTAFMSDGALRGDPVSEMDDLHAILEMGRRILLSLSFFDVHQVATDEGAAEEKVYAKLWPNSDQVMGIFMAVSPYTKQRTKTWTLATERFRDLSALFSAKYESFEAFQKALNFLERKIDLNSLQAATRTQVANGTRAFQQYMGENVVSKMSAREIAEMLITCEEYDVDDLGLPQFNHGTLWTDVKAELRTIKNLGGKYRARVDYYDDNPYFVHPEGKERIEQLLSF